MLIIISSSKSLNTEMSSLTSKFSIPDNLSSSNKIIKEIRNLSPAEISQLMDISSNLALLNFDRFAAWEPNHKPQNAKQAIYTYTGDVYRGMDVKFFKKQDLEYAQKHLRIISGLYGLLKPLDLIKPYRLEMGAKLQLKQENKKNLYEFWTRRISTCLKNQLEEQNSNLLVNLASNEYFKAIDTSFMETNVITPVFKDLKNGAYKIIGIYAKKARGEMAAYIIRNKIDDKNIEELKSFTVSGYGYTPSMSSEKEWVFTRQN